MRAYSLFDVTNFPTAERFNTNLQIDHTYTVDNTSFARTGDICGQFTAYAVQHVNQVHFRGFPYHHGEMLDEVSEKHMFEAFLHHNRDFLLIQYSRKISREAAKRLAKLEEKTRAVGPTLDVLKLVEEFPHLYGTYFRDVQSAGVKSSALFGADVDSSEFYKTFREMAKLSAIITEAEHAGVNHKLLITSNYGIGFYKPVDSATELTVIGKLKPTLDKYRVAVEPEKESLDDDTEEVTSPLFD
jgi:hypothetical protein